MLGIDSRGVSSCWQSSPFWTAAGALPARGEEPSMEPEGNRRHRCRDPPQRSCIRFSRKASVWR